MNVKFLGPVRACRAVLPHMRLQGEGLIVHVSSMVGRVVFPACALYCASKFALEAYAEVLHYEVSGLGVESVIVEPGPFPTQLLANSPGPADLSRGIQRSHRSNTGQPVRYVFEVLRVPAEYEPAGRRRCDRWDRQRPSGQASSADGVRTDCGAIAINEHTAPIQADVLRALGMSAMAQRAAGATAG